MNIERRLHHAARELREVPIDVPVLGDPSLRGRPRARRPRLAASAAPMLFVAGGLLAVGVMQREVPEPAHSDIPTAPAEADPPAPDAGGADAATPSVSEELRLIAGLLDETPLSPRPPVVGNDALPSAGGAGPI